LITLHKQIIDYELEMFQASLSSVESKLRQSSSDLAGLQAKVGEYERLLEDNHSQVCYLLLASLL